MVENTQQFFQFVSDFHFLRPMAFFLLLIPVLLYLALFVQKRAGKSVWSMPEHLQKALLLDENQKRWWGPLQAGLLAMILMVLIFAGPSFKKQQTPFTQDAYDLVILISLSSSMAQEDIQPSRLERAKQKLHDLLELRQGGRVALVVWAGSAHRVVPFTADKDIIWNFLLALDTGSMPEDGNDIGNTVPLLEQLLSQKKNQSSSTGLLIVSDGFSGEQRLLEYLSGNSDLDVQLYAVGSSQATEDYTAMNAVFLKQFASKTGASYQEISIDKSDIRSLAAGINKQQREMDSKDDRPWQDDGYLLLWPLMLLFLQWFRKGWALQWNWLLPAVLLSSVFVLPAQPVFAEEAPEPSGEFIDLWLTADQKGQWFFKRGEYRRAAVSYQDPWRKALASYFAGEFSDVVKLLAENNSEQALFLKGNAYAHQRAYVLGRQQFKKLLELNPQHSAAKKNYQILDKIIREADEFTKHQKEEASVGGEDLGDGPQSSEGQESKMGQAEAMSVESGDGKAEQQDVGKRKQLSAEQILKDEKLQQTWMKQVSQDPSVFLRMKFQTQALNRSTESDYHKTEQESSEQKSSTSKTHTPKDSTKSGDGGES